MEQAARFLASSVLFDNGPDVDSVPDPKSMFYRPNSLGADLLLWPYFHIYGMGCHMKTTLNIDENVMRELKREAARQGRTMSDLVESALRLLLRSKKPQQKLPPLPRFRGGGSLVDVDDRNALYEAMEER
jgi:hypothetical protein